jgi:hypothetical protein
MSELSAPLQNEQSLGDFNRLLGLLINLPFKRLELNLSVESLKLVSLQHIFELQKLRDPFSLFCKVVLLRVFLFALAFFEYLF